MLRNTSINGWFIGRRKDDEGKARFMVVSPAVWQYDVVSPTMSAAALMLFFGPFLLADGQLTIIANYYKISQQKNNYKDGGNE